MSLLESDVHLAACRRQYEQWLRQILGCNADDRSSDVFDLAEV